MVNVSAIIPAYNEEKTITKVLNAVASSDLVNDIFVVDDGSQDNTSIIVEQIKGINLITLDKNAGKGNAIKTAAKKSNSDIVLLLDADLLNFSKEHVDQLLMPILSNEAEMTIGVFTGGRFFTDLSHILVPVISGQRALKRDFLLEVPELEGARYGVEAAITKHAILKRLTTKKVNLEGVTHIMKEEKMGIMDGCKSRVLMYLEILDYLLRNNDFKKFVKKD